MPPAADSMCPLRCVCAPVKEPFSWPNSSLSSRFSGMALQLMATNGPFLCGLRRWSACATISLPVPLSPRIKTGAVVGATLRMKVKTACIGGLAPSMSSKTSACCALLQGAVFLLELGHVDAPLQHELELVHVHRLAEEVVGARPDGAKRVLLVALAGDDDHFGQRIQREQRRERRQPFVGFVGTGRKPQIEQRHRGMVGRERRHCSGTVPGHGHLVVRRERPLHLGADVLVVLHDEERRFRHCSSLTGKLTRNVVPLPTSLSTCMPPPCAWTIARD